MAIICVNFRFHDVLGFIAIRDLFLKEGVDAVS